MNILFNRLGKIVDGGYINNFCKIEALRNNDYMVYIIDDKNEIIESFYCEDMETIHSLNLNVIFPNKYDILDEQTVLGDFADKYNKTNIKDYLPQTQNVINLLCEIIKDNFINNAIKEILQDDNYMDLTNVNYIAKNLIEKEDYGKLPNSIKDKVKELSEME